uniref:Disease resistance protein At4g27190-like leucine-rich repeats domain-containing protein n=1 Tax=Nelumbo nucifera TaxID=4432 RepID=A0A822Z8Z5_NELNU|nr:TPA_asm: hypothetical protein HUJ06_014504 [Nelumbo nucifera]
MLRKRPVEQSLFSLKHNNKIGSYLFHARCLKQTPKKLSDIGVKNMKGLQVLFIEGCERVESVINGNHESSGSSTASTSHHPVVLPNLQVLYLIRLANLRRNWEGPAPPQSLNMLTWVKVFECHNVQCIFLRRLIQQLPNTWAIIMRCQLSTGCN